MHYPIVLATAAFAVSITATPLQERSPFPGVATFNDYVDQVHNRNQPTVCGPYYDDGNIFAAAAGDLSPDISKGNCSYTPQEESQDRSLWYVLEQMFFPCSLGGRRGRFWADGCVIVPLKEANSQIAPLITDHHVRRSVAIAIKSLMTIPASLLR